MKPLLPRVCFWLLPMILLALAACDSGGDEGRAEPEDTGCIVPTRLLNDSVPIDAIPALTEPELVNADAVDYLQDDALVLGLHLGDLTVAVPHNILNFHEVINFSRTTPRVAVTFCPLTGSGLAFDRAAIDDVRQEATHLIHEF